MQRVIELFEKCHRLQVFPSTQSIAQPRVGFTPVVQIEHRRDGVDAQSVEVELLDPEQRVGQQEVAHFMARVVEDVRAPLGVVAESRIFVLVARGPVKPPQRPIVLGEMRRHPVQQHPNARLVQRINEGAEIVGRTMARRGRKVSAYLIPP